MEHIQRYKRRLNIYSAFANINEKTWFFIRDDAEFEVISNPNQILVPEEKKHLLVTMLYAKCTEGEKYHYGVIYITCLDPVYLGLLGRFQCHS